MYGFGKLWIIGIVSAAFCVFLYICVFGFVFIVFDFWYMNIAAPFCRFKSIETRLHIYNVVVVVVRYYYFC